MVLKEGYFELQRQEIEITDVTTEETKGTNWSKHVCENP
jgi:hypothetical protein